MNVREMNAGAMTRRMLWALAIAGMLFVVMASVAGAQSAPDNESTVVVEVVNEVPVVLVESAPDLAEMQRDAFFVQAALGWLDGESLDERGVHAPTLMEPARLERTDLRE